jgi:predicted Ser/Thr protein kinase
VLPQAADARPGPRIGRYRITGRIGRGGMGMVYRGLDAALEREVAIKTLVAEGSFDPESRRRFEIEARAAAKLAHPNIVTVHELGEDRGILFIAMEMLPGVDLDSLLRSGEALPLAERLDVVAQVCRGLAFAHERGVVHRDIKPSNVRLLDDGTAKIMDFGIAKLGASHHITKTGMMVGTVHYMSPEQVRGKPLDGRTDVFSAGVILYELLAGERPFPGEDVTQILYKIVNEEPKPLDLSGLGELAPQLQEVLAKALAKDAEARYAGAGAFGQALSALALAAQKAPGAAASATAEALVTARSALRDGHVEEAVARLRGLVAEHPDSVDARRALRAAQREQKSRQEPRAPGSDGYPELEATFQAARTRHADPGGDQATLDGRAATELAPTVVGGHAQAPSPVALETGMGPRGWLLALGGLVAVIALAWAVLWRAAPPLTTGAAPAASPAAAALAPATTEAKAAPAALATAVHVLRAHSLPPGATVALDGGAAQGVTPLDLSFDPASEHRISFSLAGYAAQEVRTRPGAAPSTLEVTLEKLVPPGSVAVASAYELDVVWRGRTLARAEASPRVQLTGGRQVLTLVAAAVFLKTDVSVDVPPGGEVGIEAPGLGKLNVRATPDNCEVFVGDVFVDYPPILDRPVAAGRHNVSFRWPDGARSQQAVEVKAGAPAFVIGRKE